MRYSDALTAIAKTWKQNPSQVFYLQSSPGTGKTSLCMEAARRYLQAAGLTDEECENRILLFRPSIHDPVDLLGIPSIADGQTVFAPPAMLHRFRKGTGPGVVIWDELPQSVPMMQNAIAGALLDKQIANIVFDSAVVQIATGNRVEDKAGANRLLTQVGNRVCTINLDVSVDDVTSYFFDKNLDIHVVAFLRARPDLLNDFDPSRSVNATPRSWEMGARSVPRDLPKHIRLELWAGYIGQGPATEFIAACEMLEKLPSTDEILLAPETAPLPTEPAMQYGVSVALAARTDKPDVFEQAYKYMRRLPPTYYTAYVIDVIRRVPEIKQTKTFIEFARAHAELVFGE